MVGRNPGTVSIDDAKAIGVTIGGESRGRTGFGDGLAQRREIFFRDVRTSAIEQTIAIRPHRLDRDAVIGEDAVEIAAPQPCSASTTNFALPLRRTSKRTSSPRRLR